MPDQEFLASFGVQIDESGLNRLQQALEKNRTLAENLSAAFDRARSSVQSFFQELSQVSLTNLDYASSARVTEQAQQGFQIPFSLDFTKAGRELQAFLKASGKPLKLTADASAVWSAGVSALSALQSLYSSSFLPLRVKTEVQQTSTAAGGGGSPGGITLTTLMRASIGGRFSRPTRAEIAEDGDPEYVIPVKKESLAVPLLRQLLGELSEGARETLRTGMTTSRSLSGYLSSAASAAAPVVNQNTTNSVQAPVTIQVTASGSNPEAVGRSVYDVAEQYLLRTLKSVIN